jgi:hypothetical protein
VHSGLARQYSCRARLRCVKSAASAGVTCVSTMAVTSAIVMKPALTGRVVPGALVRSSAGLTRAVLGRPRAAYVVHLVVVDRARQPVPILRVHRDGVAVVDVAACVDIEEHVCRQLLHDDLRLALVRPRSSTPGPRSYAVRPQPQTRCAITLSRKCRFFRTG